MVVESEVEVEGGGGVTRHQSEKLGDDIPQIRVGFISGYFLRIITGICKT